MIALRDWTTANLVGLLALAAAVAWALVVGVNAVLLEPLPVASSAEMAAPAYPRSRAEAAASAQAILTAVHRNPMRPDRQRAEGRYGQARAPEIAEAERPGPIPDFHVVGIVRRRSGADLAAIGRGRSPSELVRVGGEIEGFTLNRIGADSIFLARADTAIGLPLPGPGYRTAGR